MLLGLYLFLVIALPLALGSFVAFNGLPRSRRCPACTGETVRLQSRLLGLVSRVVRTQQLQSRWCPACEWHGTARLGTGPVFEAGPDLLTAVPVASTEPEPEPEPDWLGSSVEIRRISVDGDAWRVRVECWAEGDGWTGRLLFVAASGRSCIEDHGRLSGSSAIDVLSQVLSLPERALAGRIRKATR